MAQSIIEVNRWEEATMGDYERKYFALHAPNIVNICIDGYDNGEMAGRIYHCYDKNPGRFTNLVKLIQLAEELYDKIDFPQASTQIRTFNKNEQPKPEEITKVVTAEELAAYRGEVSTFLLYVKYRQNSCWQGEVRWVEGECTHPFASVLELMKIMSNYSTGSCIYCTDRTKK